LEKAQAASLTRSLRLSGQTGVVQEGLWLMSVDQVSHTFQISPLQKGSHLDTWTVFCARVSELKTGAATSAIAAASDRQEVSLVLDDIEAILRTPPAHSAANWLSYMRNQLNYQHAHGAWYPHQRSSRFRTSVIEQLDHWRERPAIDLPRAPHILHRFTACNVAIVAWMRETVLRLCDKHPDNDSFLKYGAVRVLNQCG
jgi:hypothetical protein